MATYDSLLIDAGGGVIDHNNQSDRCKEATVIIGLGGTGADTVIKLKKEVYRQLKPDDVHAVIPRYSNIRYLIIDSESGAIDRGRGMISDIDSATEFLNINMTKEMVRSLNGTGVPDKADETEVPMKDRNKFDWLSYEHISIDDNMQACSAAVRQIGRFLLVSHAQKIYERIKAVLQEAVSNSNGRLRVHICAGISGGTGSGIFLDVCYLVREALKEISKPETLVCGYFFLPEVNLSVPVVASNPLISGQIQVNGYAALQELDYCMNFCRNLDSFRMDYGFMQIENRQKPVDMCFLVSAKDEAGKMIGDGYQYALSIVVEFIISSMTMEQLPERMESDVLYNALERTWMWFEICKRAILLQHGASVDYIALGISVAEISLAEINAYLGYKLFERFADVFDRTPTEEERNVFLLASQLKYEDIRKALSKGCPSQINFPQVLDAKMFKERGNGKFVEFAEEYLARNRGELEKNSKTLMASMRDYAIPEDSRSLIGRTYKALCEKFVTNVDYGPCYAQRMLYGTQNQNLVHAVNGFIVQNQTNLEAELRQSQRRGEEYEAALARMRSANFLNERRRMEDYLNALNNLYVHHYKVEMLEIMNVVLQDYKQQLIRLNNNYFHILTTVLDTLQKSFQANGRALTQESMAGNGCKWKIISVPEIQEMLDAEVERLDFQQINYNMMMTMMDNYAKWENEDENEITRLISDFILKTFWNANMKTITDYLMENFQTENHLLLVQRIEEEIIRNKLAVDSIPLFWKNPMYRDAVGGRNMLTVPFDSAEIKEAAHEYADRWSEYAVLESSIKDKISMMRLHCGLPMYAFQGILELQDKYENDYRPGRHLYEHGEADWNKLLPSLVPASFKAGMPIARIENKNNALIAEFEKAEEEGVVIQDSLGNWFIMVMGVIDMEIFVDTFVEEEGGYKTGDKIVWYKLRDLIIKLEEESNKQKSVAKPLRIECMRGYNGSERQVMLDFYLKSPVLNKTVHDELEKRETMARRITELSTLMYNNVGSAEE